MPSCYYSATNKTGMYGPMPASDTGSYTGTCLDATEFQNLINGGDASATYNGGCSSLWEYPHGDANTACEVCCFTHT